MFFVRKKIGKRFINLLMTSNCFNRYFVVLTWDETYIIRRTKPIDELIKIKITPKNILTLKFKYHSSRRILKEYIAEIDRHSYESQMLYLNIWTTEQKTKLITQTSIYLTKQTNETLKQFLEKKVFKEKYGENYTYFISLHLDRQNCEVTLKYSLSTDLKKNEMRLKSKFNISKNEARVLCCSISYWDVTDTNP
jgi:uncharacterized membrane protein